MLKKTHLVKSGLDFSTCASIEAPQRRIVFTIIVMMIFNFELLLLLDLHLDPLRLELVPLVALFLLAVGRVSLVY